MFWSISATGLSSTLALMRRPLNLCLRLGGACGGRLFSYLLNKSPQVFD